MSSLLARLSRTLGVSQAAVELRWLRHAAHDEQDLEHMVNRRAQGEPLQYVLGKQPFGPLNILTRKPVLIPRPETEQWTSELAEKISSISRTNHRPLRILDLCTGTACIPLLLCTLLNNRDTQVAALGIDILSDACKLARDNIASITVSPASSLAVQQCNIFDRDFWKTVEISFCQLRGVGPGQDIFPLDVITANPPYIPLSQWQQLPIEVKDWEDPGALLGDPYPSNDDIGSNCSAGTKGLTFYERIRDLVSSPDILSPNGILAMEVGDGQADDVACLFDTLLGPVEVWKDWWGKERAVFVYGVGLSALMQPSSTNLHTSYASKDST